MVRDVDRLEPLPDNQIRQQDQQYLEQYGVEKLIAGLMDTILREQPSDPVQFIIDTLQHDKGSAQQDSKTGISYHRKDKLEQVFQFMDKSKNGMITVESLQQYAGIHGGKMLSNDELKDILEDFRPADQRHVTLEEFIRFFAKMSRSLSNADFDKLVSDLMA